MNTAHVNGSASHHSDHHDDHISENKQMPSPPVVAIIGLGLIGASFAAALKQANEQANDNDGPPVVDQIIGIDNDALSVSYCKDHNYIDATAENAREAAARADIVVLAAPVSALGSIVSYIAPYLRKGTVITDVASVKGEAIDAIAPLLPEGVDFVPAHPIAGKAISGASAADADLFKEKLVVLAPDKRKTAKPAIEAVHRLWEAAGSHVEHMPPDKHDQIYGYVSHLPQIMAFAACKTMAETKISESYAPGKPFSDFIRIGSSSPVLWRGIVQANRKPVLQALDKVLAALDQTLETLETSEEGKNKDRQSSPALPGLASADMVTRQFPLLVNDALLSAVSQFEKEKDINCTSYAGSGFRDFTAPAQKYPGVDTSEFLASHAPVADMLTRFRDQLGSIREALADETDKSGNKLESLLFEGQYAHGFISTQRGNMASRTMAERISLSRNGTAISRSL